MNYFEPYIIFITAALSIVLLIISLYSVKRFELVIAVFTLSTFIASFFYVNEPGWFLEGREAGIGGYIRGGFLIFSGIYGLVMFTLLFRHNKFRIPLHLILLLGFIIYSLSSVYYSIDFTSTLIRSVIFLNVFLFLLYLHTWLDSKEKLSRFLNVLFIVSIVLLTLHLIGTIAWPSRAWWWKASSRLIGLSSHPNELGGFCIVTFPILFWKLYNSVGNIRYFLWTTIILNSILLLATGSRTSLGVGLIGILIWFLIHKDWIKLLSLSLVLILGFILFYNITPSSYQRDKDIKIFDLSEREYIWEGAVLFAQKKPIIGYGYSVESKIFANQYLYDLEGINVDINAQSPLHNGYLSIFIGGGSIGLLLWLSAILLPLFLLLRGNLNSYKAYVFATIIPILLANFVESAVIGYFASTDIYFWLAWIVGGRVNLLYDNIENNDIVSEGLENYNE